MVSTPEEINDDSPSLNTKITAGLKPIARKSLHLFTNIFDVKKRTSIRCVGASQSKLRSINDISSLWTNKTNVKDIQKSMIRLNKSFIHV